MKPHFETLAVHGGQKPDSSTLSRGVPVYRTAAYMFKSAEHASRLFSLEEPGNIYSRLGNPTQAVLEERINLLEGGVGALASASGTSAVFSTIINIARQGDEIVSASALYGGTFTMFDAILPQFGITTRFVKATDFSAIEAAFTPKTRVLYVEAIGNPVLEVPDLDALSTLAHKYQVPLVVDATFATPYLLRPFEHGADIVLHSLTKWLGGHGAAIGGIVVDGGNFNWKNERFDLYARPDESYHGLRWGYDLPEGMPPFITRMRTVPLRNLGACLSPDNAWMLIQGIETLPLRMERHCSNALTVAHYLEQHPKVDWVRYPGLPGDPAYGVASRLFKNGFGGMVVFGIKGRAGGKAAGQQFIESLHLFSHLANVGDAKSLALHPGSTTHSQLSEVQQQAAGLSPEMIRLSIGLEHRDDIIADLEQALATIQ